MNRTCLFRKAPLSLAVLSAGMLLLPLGASASPPGGHEVLPTCVDDVICHFEGDFCGTPVGTVIECDGFWNMGICLFGDGSIDLGDDDTYTRDEIELECQVYLDRLPDTPGGIAGLVTKYVEGDPANSEWGIFVEAGADPSEHHWLLCGDGGVCVRTDPGTANVGYYWVKGILCASSGILSVNDGEIVAEGPLSKNPANTPTHVIIGDTASGGAGLFGMIDEVRIGCTNCGPVSTESRSWGTVKVLYR